MLHSVSKPLFGTISIIFCSTTVDIPAVTSLKVFSFQPFSSVVLNLVDQIMCIVPFFHVFHTLSIDANLFVLSVSQLNTLVFGSKSIPHVFSVLSILLEFSWRAHYGSTCDLA